ncbi:MAG: hypothetical protein R3D98_02780 [Candidatus Krumholzibacteriia bacterium]
MLGALVVSLASIAWAGVPDLNTSTASIDPAANGASVFNLPNGAGVALDQAFGVGGTVDATITLTLIDTTGDPIFGYPFEDLWLETSLGGLTFCDGGTAADASTDIDGMTTWSNPLAAGGNSAGETTRVIVAGAPLAGAGLSLTFNSADINGDLIVNLSDVATFTQALATYTYDADFNNDGIINLSDVARFTQGIGTSCN